MRRVIIGVVLVSIATAYVAGYWPTHRRVLDLQEEVDALRAQLTSAEARVRLAALLGRLLAIGEAIEASNFGQAQQLSSQFFDEVRAENARTPDAGFRTVLGEILDSRDRITAGLTRTDRTTLDLLRQVEHRLRAALGYPRAA